MQHTVKTIIEMMNQKFDCVIDPHHEYLFFYTSKPTERKTLFAVLNCSKNTASVMFRINPDTFIENDDKVRKVVGWFFPRGTERRITIKDEYSSQILRCLEHTYTSTNYLLQVINPKG